MHRLKAHLANWVVRRLVFPFCHWLLPIVVLPPWLQHLYLRWQQRRAPTNVRPIPPLSEIRPLALILRHADVCEVLGDHERFSVKTFEEKMQETSNPFVLGMGFTDEYRRQIKILRSVLKPEDRDRVREIAERRSSAAVGAARANGRIDVVQQLDGPVVAGFLDEYFIGNLPEGTERLSPLLKEFLTTASYIFNVDIVTGYLKEEAIAAGRKIKDRVDAIIQAKRKSASTAGPSDDAVIDRLLRSEGVSDDLVHTLIGGTVSGTIAVVFSQFLWVVDRLMSLPPLQLAEVQSVASGGDDALLGRYVREASRFKPFPPALLRRCEDDQEIPRHARRPKKLSRGTVVAAFTWSAAFDRKVVENPHDFCVGRPDRHYLLFGTGQHHCLGAQPERPIAQTLMGQMAEALFRLPKLRRAPGAAGFIQNDDSGWAASFTLEFDRAA